MARLIQVGPAYKVRKDGDSFVVTLPRAWREQNDIRAGDELVPYVDSDRPSHLVQVHSRDVNERGEVKDDITD